MLAKESTNNKIIINSYYLYNYIACISNNNYNINNLLNLVVRVIKAITFLEISFQSEVCTKKYRCPKWWKS
jgi:hypothetical protein